MTPSSLPPRPTVIVRRCRPCMDSKRPQRLPVAEDHDDEWRLDDVGASRSEARPHTVGAWQWTREVKATGYTLCRDHFCHLAYNMTYGNAGAAPCRTANVSLGAVALSYILDHVMPRRDNGRPELPDR